MKKFLALIICLMMVVLPMAAMAEADTTEDTAAETAAANATVLTVAIEGGDTYSVTFGTDAEGEIIAKTTVSGMDIAAQFGADAAYVNVMGMNIAIAYDELMDLVGDAGEVTGSDVPAIDTAALIELGTKLGADMGSLITTEATETGMNVSAEVTGTDIWNACGEDLTAWVEANGEMIDSMLTYSGDESVTAAQLLEVLKAVDASTLGTVKLSLDCGYSMDLTAPSAHLNFNVTEDDQTAADISFAADMTGVSFTAATADANLSFLAAVEDDGSFGIYLNDAKLATVTIADAGEPVERLTDGSDAMSISDLLSMANAAA